MTYHVNYFKVSKCEKFGYGCMLTQVAATSPGMLALLNTGNLRKCLYIRSSNIVPKMFSFCYLLML